MATENSRYQQVDIQVGFDGEVSSTYRPSRLVFEMDDRKDPEQLDFGTVRIRHYPAQPTGTYTPVGTYIFTGGEAFGYRYMVTEGNIYFTSEVRERRVVGAITLTGGTEADLPYPVLNSLSIEVDGVLYDALGRDITAFVRVSFDQYRQKIVTSRPAYGTLRYDFVTHYRIMRYTPSTYYADAVFYAIDEVNYGQLFAFPLLQEDINQPVGIVNFSIRPPEGVNTRMEICRVVSKALVRDDGIYEMPNGWPDTKTYPDQGVAAFDAATYIEVERVHKIYYLRIGDPARRAFETSSSDGIAIEPQIAKNPADSVLTLSTAKGMVSLDHDVKSKRGVRLNAVIEQSSMDVPWAKPYDQHEPEPVRLVVQILNDGQPVVTQTRTVMYHRQLTVKASQRPANPSINANGVTALVDEYQSRINDVLYAAWQVIDWKSIREEIRRSFDPELYDITYDTSVPTE
jgi:hypothetical protein